MHSIASSLPLNNRKYLLLNWWKSIDHTIFFGFILLGFFGIILIASAGPSVARRINISDGILPASWLFLVKYIIFFSISVLTMVGASLLSAKMIRRVGVVIFLVSMILLLFVPFIGNEIKGAKRWIFGLQPSEFVKPSFIIFSAWMMSISRSKNPILPNPMLISFSSLLVVLAMLLVQPDVGQTILISSVWTVMFFVSGANSLWFIAIFIVISLGIIGGYYFFDHVKNRIDAFLAPDNFDKFGINYQSEVAKKAFNSGGFLGRGPGEGEIKNTLPDAHTDYIFAVAGEELGLIICMLIIFIYGFIILHTLMKSLTISNHFIRFAIIGLITLFGFQSFINMAVNLGVFPPKGMTLPFISYGGSSLLSIGILGGFIIALLRDNK